MGAVATFPDRMKVLPFFSFLFFIFLTVDPVSQIHIIQESGPIDPPAPCALGHYWSPNQNKCVPRRRRPPIVKSVTSSVTPSVSSLPTPCTGGCTDEPDVLKSEPHVLTTEPDVLSTEFDVLTTEPDVLTSEPDVLTSEPDAPKSEPDVLTSEPDVLTSEPDVLTSVPDVLTSEPDVLTSELDVLTSNAQ